MICAAAGIAEGTDVPIYILGSSTDSAHLAARKGLPYAFASHFAPDHLDAALATYRQQFQPSATLDKPHVMANLAVRVPLTDAADRPSFETTVLFHALGAWRIRPAT